MPKKKPPKVKVEASMDLFAWLSNAAFHTINRKLDRIMADLTALSEAADQISTDVGEAIVALDELAAKLAENGDTTSQEAVDAITEKLKAAGSSLDAAVAEDNPGDTPPPPPVDA